MHGVNEVFRSQGHSDGGVYRYLYPSKSAQVNFLWGKNDVRTAIQQFYTPQKLLYPPKQVSGYALLEVPEIDDNTKIRSQFWSTVTTGCCGAYYPLPRV